MENIKSTLKQYHSSFNVAETTKLLSIEHKETIRNKLINEMSSSIEEFSTCMEKVRLRNLLSFLCFILGDRKKAIYYNDMALEISPDSIIALSNKAWFSLEDRKNFKTCEDVCERLKYLKTDKMANLVAKAEIAYTYARCGLKFYDTAVSEFKTVIREFDWNEEKSVSFPVTNEGGTGKNIREECYCVWMYGCALSLQRLSNVHNMHDVCEGGKIKENYRFAAELYARIINLGSDRSECIQRHKARSFIELGFMSYDVTRMISVFPDGMESILPARSLLILPTHTYFTNALEIYPKDVFVLERSGKYFRYEKDFQQSIDLLNSAVKITETSFGHHHLALSYIRLLELNQPDLAHHLHSMSIHKGSNINSDFQQNIKKSDIDKHTTDLLESNRRMVDQRETGKQIHQDTPEDIHGHFAAKSEGTECVGPLVETKQNQISHGSNGDSVIQTQRDLPCLSNSTLNPNANIFYSRNKTSSADRKSMTASYQTAHDTSRSRSRSRESRRRFQYGASANKELSYSCNQKATIRFPKRKDKLNIKCPQHPILIEYEENKEVIENIFSHLDKAAKLSTNTAAIYDKALLYRKINQPVKALDVLEPLMQNPGELNSPVMLANIYEQAAFCINDILDETQPEEDEILEQLRCDRNVYLKSSLEISCNIVAKIPSLHTCWKSATTLKDILLDKSKRKRNKQTLRDLWFIYDKLNNHFEAIGVLKELQDLAEDDTEKEEIIEDIVMRQMHLRSYEEAVIALCMSKSLKDGFSSVESSLYLSVYIEAGLDAFRKKHFEKARLRIRKAFELQCENGDRNRERNTSKDEDSCFELLILSNLDDDEAGRKLMTLLSQLGIKTTLNTDSPSVTPGTPEIQGITEVMDKSEAFAILLNDFDVENKTMKHIADRMQKVIESRADESSIVVLTSTGTEFAPTCVYSTYTKIYIDIASLCDTETENLLEDDSMRESIKSMLMDVAMTKRML